MQTLKNSKLRLFDQKVRLICVSFEYFQQSYWRWEDPVVCRQHVKALLDVEYRSGMCRAAAEYWGSMEAYWAGGSLLENPTFMSRGMKNYSRIAVISLSDRQTFPCHAPFRKTWR